MHLIQILLPVYGNDGKRLPRAAYETIREELAAKFGGLTAFTQSPAEGIWIPDKTRIHRDEVIMIEVMTETLDSAWWSGYRKSLEAILKQEAVVVRCLPMHPL